MDPNQQPNQIPQQSPDQPAPEPLPIDTSPLGRIRWWGSNLQSSFTSKRGGAVVGLLVALLGAQTLAGGVERVVVILSIAGIMVFVIGIIIVFILPSQTFIRYTEWVKKQNQ